MLHLRLRAHIPLTKVVTRMSSTSIRTMVVLRTGMLALPFEMEDNLFRAMSALRYPDKLRSRATWALRNLYKFLVKMIVASMVATLHRIRVMPPWVMVLKVLVVLERSVCGIALLSF